MALEQVRLRIWSGKVAEMGAGHTVVLVETVQGPQVDQTPSDKEQNYKEKEKLKQVKTKRH